jgi:hypothetical protein
MHVWVRVAEWVGEEEKNTYCCYVYRLHFLTCDMYKSSLRHIHDPVLSSLKMKGILSFFLSMFTSFLYAFRATMCPIIRTNNCIYATHGTCHSVWMTVWYAGMYGQKKHKNCITRGLLPPIAYKHFNEH